MKTSGSSLAPILRSDTQGRILARVMLEPDREQSLTTIAQHVGSSHTTVLREIDRAEQAGIVTTRKEGQSRLVRANPTHPLWEPLTQIVVTTYGPPAVIAEEFAGIEGVEAVYLFGSWAARYRGHRGRWPNDIDVLIVGDPDRDDVHDAAERAERRLGLPVQTTIRTRASWNGDDDPFVVEVRSRPMVALVGENGLVS